MRILIHIHSEKNSTAITISYFPQMTILQDLTKGFLKIEASLNKDRSYGPVTKGFPSWGLIATDHIIFKFIISWCHAISIRYRFSRSENTFKWCLMRHSFNQRCQCSAKIKCSPVIFQPHNTPDFDLTRLSKPVVKF